MSKRVCFARLLKYLFKLGSKSIITINLNTVLHHQNISQMDRLGQHLKFLSTNLSYLKSSKAAFFKRSKNGFSWSIWDQHISHRKRCFYVHGCIYSQLFAALFLMGTKNAIAQFLVQIRSIRTSPAEGCLKFTKSKYYIFLSTVNKQFIFQVAASPVCSSSAVMGLNSKLS